MSEEPPKPNSSPHWYAVATRSRHEKVVAEQLWQKEVECFLPLHEVRSKWKDRYKKVQFPLFPGYLFVHVPIEQRRLDILKVPSVVRIVGFEGQPASIPEAQMESVKRLVFSTMTPILISRPETAWKSFAGRFEDYGEPCSKKRASTASSCRST